MSNVVHSRGRLPARVYWFRRTMVLVTILALVFAVVRLLGGPDDPGARNAGSAAAVAGSTPRASASATPTPVGPMPLRPRTAGTTPTATGAPVVLAEPTSPCAADEITVKPSVPSPVAGGTVKLLLELTGVRPACTFAVSKRTVVARVTSGTDRIWSTQDCPASIRMASVVVRSAVPAKVVVHWSGRRSDDDCTRSTPWALPGYYHVTAAVIGSEPGDAQFRLTNPPRPIVTKTAKPKNKKRG